MSEVKMVKLEGLATGDTAKEARSGYHLGGVCSPEGKAAYSSTQVKQIAACSLPLKDTPALDKGRRIHGMIERLMWGKDVRVVCAAGRKGSKAYIEQSLTLLPGDELVTASEFDYYVNVVDQIKRFKDTLPSGYAMTETVCLNPKGAPFYRKHNPGNERGFRAQADMLWMPEQEALMRKLYDWKTTSKRSLPELMSEVYHRGYAYSAWHYYHTFEPYVKRLSPLFTLVFLVDKYEGLPVQITIDVTAPGFEKNVILPYIDKLEEKTKTQTEFIEGGEFHFSWRKA